MSSRKVGTANAHLLPAGEARRLFHALPYAGNHNDVGTPDAHGNQLAVFVDNDGNRWVFLHDESWDNVDAASVNGVDL